MSLIKFGNSLVTKNNFAIHRIPKIGAYTLRLRFEEPDYSPELVYTRGTWSKVPYVKTNDWDWHLDDGNWHGGLSMISSVHHYSVIEANTHGVFDMSNLFTNSGITSCVDIQNGGVNICSYMFQNTLIESAPRLDIRNCVYCTGLFDRCANLKYIPENFIITKENAIMNNMFSFCTSLETVPLFDTSKAISLTEMFSSCRNLRNVPLFDTSNAGSLKGMFKFCTSLESVPLFDTSNATNLSEMFYECSLITSIPQLDTSKATDISYLCYDCGNLSYVTQINVSNVLNTDHAFWNCESVTTGALSLYQALTNTGKVTNHNKTFYECGKNNRSGRLELEQIPSDWK